MAGRARSRRLAALRLALGVALVTGSVSLAVAQPVAAYPASCRETFMAPSPVVVDPYSTAATGSFDVTVAGQVADVDVHLWATDVHGLTFSFGPADGSRAAVKLASVSGGIDGSEVDLQDATWDDEAEGVPGDLAGTSPFSGSYRPFDSLATLDGLVTARSWALTVESTSTNKQYVGPWSITLTYAACTPDGDSDAVPDSADACDTIAAATASGCPAAARALTVRYRHGAFKGVLSSSTPACRAGKAVVIWKVRRGPDRRIGRATSRSDGSYRLARAHRPGRYYASSAAVVVCPTSRSARPRGRPSSASGEGRQGRLLEASPHSAPGRPVRNLG